MCGRFSLYVSPKILEEHYGAHFEETPNYPEYNVAPSVFMPIITNEDVHLLQMVKWGIKPKWFKAKTGLINIRAETLREKHTFQKLFTEKRCLIPSTGFYEWKKTTSGSKIPYHIKLREEKIFSFAGVWDDVKDDEGNITKSFSIITTESNSLLEDIHNRMPVILPREGEGLWLSDSANVSEVADLMNPYNPKEMEAYKVSDRINSPKNNYAEIINPV